MQGIENRWSDIQKTTKLDLLQLSQMINLVLSSSFLFNGKYYEQIYASPMGSPLFWLMLLWKILKHKVYKN